ncbi:MAG TPA: 3-keto-5-aminohexanoate cleavage protein [bacterium]|nr:3-keto-5-aminohexanoate cleavage protein [bacterium]
MRTRGILQAFSIILILSIGLLIGGCSGKKGPSVPAPSVQLISAPTLSGGETTTLFGKNFGRGKGSIKIGDSPARVITWKDSFVRIRVPKIPDGVYPVEIQTADEQVVQSGRIGIRSSEDDMFEWLETPIEDIDGSKMEPLVMMICPVAPADSKLFDYDSPMPKSSREMVQQIQWAHILGVQMARIYFPADINTGRDDFVDFTMDNVRGTISDISQKCPGMMIEAIDNGLSSYARTTVRSSSMLHFASPYTVGDFETTLMDGRKVAGVNSVDAVRKRLLRNSGYYLKSIPMVMTQWQAYSISRLIKGGLDLGSPGVFQLYMGYDDRAVDDLKTYNMIKERLPKDSRVIAVATPMHVSQIVGKAVAEGDHIAFGYQFNRFWPGDSSTYIPNNLYLVEKILDVADRIRRPIATMEQAQEMMGKVARAGAVESQPDIRNIQSPKRARNNQLPSAALKGLTIDNTGEELWVAYASGTVYTVDEGKTFKTIKSAFRKKDVEFTDVVSTDNGAMWIGTRNAGLLKTANKGKNYNIYDTTGGILDGDYIGCLGSIGNMVYACTYGTEEGNPGKGIAYTINAGKEWYVITEADGLPSNEISALYMEDELIYAGMGKLVDDGSAGGLIYSDDYGVSWTHINGIEAKVTAITPMFDNTVVVGTRKGAFLLSLGQKKARRIKGITEDTIITFVKVDNRGWLWLGTDRGVMVSSDRAKTFKNLSVNDGLGSQIVRDAEFIPPYDAWLATEAGGGAPGGLTKVHIP